MYSDPRHVRDREIKLRVDDDTYDAIDALARVHRTQKAALVRDFVMAQLSQIVEGEDTSEQTAA